MFKKSISLIVLIALLMFAQLVWAGQSQELTPDVPLQGEISEPGEQDLYTYNGQSGENLIITASAAPNSELDTTLEFYDPDGNLMQENDDSEFITGTTDSEIRITITAAGEYRVIVKGFGDTSVGAYEILLQLSDEPSQIGSHEGDDAPIELDAVERGSLELGEYDVWTFTPEEDMTVQIAMFSTTFDTSLEIYNNGALIAADDDSGGGYNAALPAFNVTGGEAYAIHAFSYDTTKGGDYILSVTRSAPAPEPVALEYGQSEDAIILPGLPTEFYFTGARDDVITVQVTSSFDTYLTLLDESSIVLIEDDDSGGELQPALLNYVLPADGKYTLHVTGYSSFEQGNFSISLSKTDFAVSEDAPIEYGQTLDGFLTNGQSASYLFSGEAGDLVNIFVSANFDTIASLYDSDDRLLVENDDSGGGLNPFIRVFKLPIDGEYKIIVTSFASDSRGVFTIALDRVNAAADKTINYDDTAEATLSTGDVALFSFEGRAGDSISVTVESDFDAYLQLRGSDGVILTEDDDSGGDLQPALLNYVLPEDDTYTLLVVGYTAQDVGSLSLTLSADAVEVTNPPDVSTGGVLQYGDSIDASLVAGETGEFTFTGSAGDVVRVSAQADFDGYLELYDPANELLASDDDSGDGLNPLLENVQLPADGEYRIVFASFDNQGRGIYTLSLSTGTTQATPPVATSGDTVLVIGDRLSEHLEVGAANAYTFEGQAGELISLGVSASDVTSDLDFYIELYQPDGALLAADDDGGWRFNPALSGVELPVSGTYKVTVQSFAGTDSGDFLLTLDSGALYFAPSGESSQPLSFEGDTATTPIELSAGSAVIYTLTASAGQTLTVTLTTGTVSTDLFGGANAIDQTLENETPFDIPAEGVYGLVFYSQSGGGDVVAITLTGEAAPPVTAQTLTVTARGEVAVDVPVQGSLQANEVQIWTFVPLLDGTYSFLLNSQDDSKQYDPSLVVLDASGAVLASDDDSGGDFDALVKELPLTANQPVTIEVHSFADQVGGDYLLAVVTEAVVAPPLVEGGEVTLDAPAQNSLVYGGQQAEFTFTAAEAGAFDFSLDGLKLPYIDIYDQSDALVGRGAAAIKGLALETGTYRIVVYDRLNRAGDFTLLVKQAEE